MISLDAYRRQWTGNIRGDLLSGLVVALALIPEAIAFSIIAGVDPKVGLYASFSIAVITAITGGRPGMISAATAATAVLMVTLVRDHGLQYLLAATVLAGLLQIGMGLLRLGFVMRYVSKSVMTGFVNALAHHAHLFMAQAALSSIPRNVTWFSPMPSIALGLAIILPLPPAFTTAGALRAAGQPSFRADSPHPGASATIPLRTVVFIGRGFHCPTRCPSS